MLPANKTHGDLHIQRKLFHLVSVLAIFMCLIFFEPALNWTLYLILGVPALAVDILRQNHHRLNRAALKVMAPILRKTEIRDLSGSSYAVLGVGLAYFLFPTPISQLAVLFLAVGDPIASYFGLLFGRHRLIGRKSLEGSMAAFLACSLAAFLFFSLVTGPVDSLLLVSFACGLTGALAELFPIRKLDDNLTQPVLSGSLMSLFFFFWGALS